MIVKLLTEHHLELLSLKGGCRGSSESTLVKLLEISCYGSINIFMNNQTAAEHPILILAPLAILCEHIFVLYNKMSHGMRFPTKWHVDKCRPRRVCAESFFA